ncbi:hypothetical protein GCM10023189_57150 [Nibrella saemangeumensis]|uniref:Rhamnogalacturonyl hydrolase YesR n=1 Tax=Nibrella saemangeumensis TaxID=1084526 RepID=A0ABP8NQG0_9BACT
MAARVPTEGKGLRLQWEKTSVTKGVRLRLTSATDVREETRIQVRTARSGKSIGEFDIRYAVYMQPYELLVPDELVPDIMQEGVVLHQSHGQKPFYVFTAGTTSQSAPAAYLPHLLLPGSGPASDAWKDRLLSLESLQTFGWMHGCNLDGIHELSKNSRRAREVLQAHLAMYFGKQDLVYANLNNQKTTNQVNGVESLLPFAILAQSQPNHPLLKLAIDFSSSHVDARGVIADGQGNRPIKTEECYTVSYPLAVMARLLNQPELAALSISTLKARVERLDREETIYQRTLEQGEPQYPNWGRGVVWYLLGLAKTLHHLPEDEQTRLLRAVFRSAVTRVLARQQPNGLWYCFTDQPDTGFETSGSAGIAAALAYGHRYGLLPDRVLPHIERTRRGLQPYLTPDGYLTGTAQANKGGPALQTGGYRVISPYTLGFLAHFMK